MEEPDCISQCGFFKDFICWLYLQVRSLTLDVRVWEPSVISYFQTVGNAYANTIWEEQLTADGRSLDESRCVKSIHWLFFISLPVILHSSKSNSLCEVFCRGSSNDRNGPVADAVRVKPSPRDSIPVKEKFIQAKVCAMHDETYCGTLRVHYSWHFELFGSWIVIGCE